MNGEFNLSLDLYSCPEYCCVTVYVYPVDISICMPKAEVSYGLRSHKLRSCGEWGQHSGTCGHSTLRNNRDKIHHRNIVKTMRFNWTSICLIYRNLRGTKIHWIACIFVQHLLSLVCFSGNGSSPVPEHRNPMQEDKEPLHKHRDTLHRDTL